VLLFVRANELTLVITTYQTTGSYVSYIVSAVR